MRCITAFTAKEAGVIIGPCQRPIHAVSPVPAVMPFGFWRIYSGQWGRVKQRFLKGPEMAKSHFPDEVTDRVPRSLTWYPDDWWGGTLTMSHVEKSCYFDLLMYQWQNGHMPVTDEERMQLMKLPECSYKVVWARLLKKMSVVYGADVLDWNGDPEQRIIVQKRMHRDRNKALITYWKRLTAHNTRENLEENEENTRKGHVTGHVTGHMGKGKRDKGKSNTKKRLGYSEAFDTFWSAVPARLKSGKARAAKHYAQAIESIGADGAEEVILAAWVNYVLSDKGRGQYAWQPCSWLRDGHYEDDPATWQDRPKEPKTRSERNMAAFNKHMEDERHGEESDRDEVRGCVVRSVQQGLLRNDG